MNSIQIYPQMRDDSSDFNDWLRAALEAAESKGFTRGVLVTFWFFYHLLNGGKPKSLSGEAEA
jgi:hypothetical protein